MPLLKEAGLKAQAVKQYIFHGLTKRNKQFMITSAANVPNEDERNETLDLYQEWAARVIRKLENSHRYNVVQG